MSQVGSEVRDSNGYLIVRWTHIALMIVVWVLTVGSIYGAMRSQLDDARSEIKELKDQHFIPASQAVNKDQFLEFENNVIRRLDRIEAAVDRRQR